MANYTIDDIEIIRKKSGITYEEAVNLLLKEEISFVTIPRLIEAAMNTVKFIENPTLEDILETEKLAKDFVRNNYSNI